MKLRQLNFLSVSFVALLGAMTGASPTMAASPAVVMPSGTLISPATAQAYFGSPSSPAAPTTRDPMVQEAARSLKYDINLIYEHVRNNVGYLPMFGLQKGARGVILDGVGTDFDQAQFMVDTLREADAVAGRGYAPSYVLGQITVSGSDFANWTGVSDATVAAKLLANGGIPATVTGTGTNFTVNMWHVWVKATVNGATYVFDPSYKPKVWHPGLAWQGASSYTLADLLANGATGSATSVSGFGTSSFRQRLNTYRGQVEGYLSANAAGMRADNVVGYFDIAAAPASDLTRAVLPYAASADYVWAGQIPDVFRTSITVALNGQPYGTYYSDAIGNNTYGFPFSYSATTNTFSGGTSVNSSGNPILGPLLNGNPFYECDQYISYKTTSATAVASVAINHPYAANGGTYADRTVSRTLTTKPCTSGTFYVTNDWGYTSGETRRRMSPVLANLSPTYTSFPFGATFTSIANQYSLFLDLTSRLTGSTFQIHDIIGIHTIDNANTPITPGGTSPTGATTYFPNNFVSMDFEASVSSFSTSNAQLGDVAAAYLAGFGLGYAESAAPRQEADSVYDMSSLSLLTQQDSRATPVGTYSTLLATPASWSSVSTGLSNYGAGDLATVQGYVGEGYSVLVPQKGALRQPVISMPITGTSYTRTAGLGEGITVDATGTYDGGELKRTAFLAWHNVGGAGTAPDRVSIAMYDPRRGGILKAGIGVPVDPGSNMVRTPDQPKFESRDFVRSALSIDPRLGTVSYKPAPDLVDGSGDFPFSLSFQRRYDQNDITNYGIGTGWRNNWVQTATLSNNGTATLGNEGAGAVSSSLVAITAIRDLVQSQDARGLYAALQTLSWLSDQTQNNTVTLSLGLDGEKSFYKQSDGTFRSSGADGETLAFQGTPSVGINNRWLYTNSAATYTDGQGSSRNYTMTPPSPGFDMSSTGIEAMYTKKTIYMASWQFPNGVKISTTYSNPLATPQTVSLYSATNNLGRSITNTYLNYGNNFQYYCTSSGGPVSRNPGSSGSFTYSTSGGLQASFGTPAQTFQSMPVGYIYDKVDQVVVSADTGAALMCPQNSLSPPVTTVSVNFVPLNNSTEADGASWIYSTSATSVPFLVPAPGGGYSTQSLPVLSGITAPGDASSSIQIAFGPDGKAQTLTDLNGKIWRHYSSPWRYEVVSPLQQAANGPGQVSYFDRLSRTVRSIDPIGRTTTSEYDQASRPSKTIKPEGDATLTAYDIRSNPIQQTAKSKPSLPVADLVSSANYMEAANVAICVNQVTCNRPAYTIDANQNRTNYTWDSTHGGLLTETSGLDATGACALAGGVCPVTTFGYSPFTGTDGSTFYLLTSKTQKIDATHSTTTTFEYNPANHWVIRSIIVDSGGLALRSCFAFNANGDLISKTEPKAGLTSCP